jgi:tetratricopeptide (TPR) repeat protein
VASVIALLALRRLAGRLATATHGPHPVGAAEGFLDAHRTVVVESLRAAVSRSCLALEAALREESVWEQLGAHLAREPRQTLLDQLAALRRGFERVASTVEEAPVPERLARALGNGRRADVLVGAAGPEVEEWYFGQLAAPELDPDALPSEIEPRLVSQLSQRLQEKGRNSIARLLELRNLLGEVWLVGLVDYFLCRALEADQRLRGQFVFVHVDRPEDLWDEELDALANLVEQQTARVAALLDEETLAPDGANGQPHNDEAIDRLFEQGHHCYLSADYQRAVELFSAALRLDPDHAALLAYRGDAYRLICDHDRAIIDYTAALKLNPNTPAVLVQRASAYRQKGDLAAVIADCTTAIDQDDEQASAYTTRADAYVDMAAFDEAIADYTRAIELHPYTPWPFFGRGKAYFQQAAYSEAIEDFGRVLALNPHHVLAQLQRGDACRYKGLLPQAIMDYSEVLRQHPRNTVAYASRGKAYEEQGDFDRALADYTQALRNDRKNVNLYCARGALYRRKDDLDLAQADLDEAIRGTTQNGEAHYNRGLVFMARGLYEEARAEFDDAVHISPGMVPAYLARALVQDRLGRYTDAIQDCGRALKVDSASAPAFVIRGIIASHAGLYPQAITDLTQAIELDPQFHLSLQERGMAHMLAGDLKRAAADATRLIAWNPNIAMAFAIRGMVRQQQGEHTQAVANFARALALDSQCLLVGLHQNLADAGRRETMRVLADYIEGVRPVLPDPTVVEFPTTALQRAEPTQVTEEQDEAVGIPVPDELPMAVVPASEPTGDQTAVSVDESAAAATTRTGTETIDHIPIPPALTEKAAAPRGSGTSAPRRARPKRQPSPQGPVLVGRAEEDLPVAKEPDAPAEEDTVFFEVDPAAAEAVTEVHISEEPTEVLATPEPTEAEAGKQNGTIPEVELLQCPACGIHTALAEPLPDGRRRCPNCMAAFVPGSAAMPYSLGGSSGNMPSLPTAPRPAVARPKKKRKDDDDDDYGDGVRMTRKQKIIIGTCGAAVLLILIYFCFPSWAWIQSAMASVPPPPEPVSVTPDELIDAFTRDTKKASQQYGGALRVRGEVATVLDNGKRLRFKTKVTNRAVDAYLGTAASDVQPKQTVTVIGEIEGWNKGALQMLDCRIAPSDGGSAGQAGVAAKK